jgi:F0F1-type ATP synthase assembly protein I
MNRYLIFTSIGFELVGIMLGSVYLGQALDDHFRTKGIALSILMFAGLASWFIHLVFLLRRIQKEDEEDNNDQNEKNS